MNKKAKNFSVEDLIKLHKCISEYDYTPKEVNKGYTMEVLTVDLTSSSIKIKPVSLEIVEKFVGGRGFGLKYLWEAINDNTKWNDPENAIIISSGPIGGITQYPGAGKSYVVTISPLTDIPIDSNVGGYFGPFLKFSGFDALEIIGKAKNDVIVIIDWDTKKIKFEEVSYETLDNHILAQQLTKMYADSEKGRRNVAVVTAGQGAENTRMGLLNFSYYDIRRKHIKLKQAGRGGIGTVFRDKKIKGLVIKFSGLRGDSNNPADLDTIIRTGIKVHREIKEEDDSQNMMRRSGTAFNVRLMNEYGFFPVENFKYGTHPDGNNISAEVFREKYITEHKADGCWYGCTLSCAKAVDNFQPKTGPYQGEKVIVDGPEYETIGAVGSNLRIFDPHAILEVNFYCDTYGIDTISFGTMCGFVMECYEEGILNNKITGGLELNFGNVEAQLELLHRMAKGEGFGKIAGQGIMRMKKIFVQEYGADKNFLNDIGMEVKGLEYSEYVCKESLLQQGGYGMANKGAHHDEYCNTFLDAVNNLVPMMDDKAEALYFLSIFRTWLSLVGLCKLPWADIVPADNYKTDKPYLIPEHIDNYVAIYNAVTGKNEKLEDIMKQSERVYNFQRVFNLRMGKGTRKYDDIPYRSVGPVTEEEYFSNEEHYDKQLKEEVHFNLDGKTTKERIKALRSYRENQYDLLRDAVYKRRGWTKDAIPTVEKLKDLGIDFPEVLKVVQKHFDQI